MNKQISLFVFFVLFFISNGLQAQSKKLKMYRANGDSIENGAELLSFASQSAIKILYSDTILLKNVSNDILSIKVRKKEVNIVDGTFNVFQALAQYVPAVNNITTNAWELNPGEILPDDAYFLASYFHQSLFGNSSIIYSFLLLNTDGQVQDSVSVTYHFLNHSVTPLDLKNEFFFNKEILISGDTDSLVSFPVKLFNHNSDSIAIRVEKEIINMEDGHNIYFSFGGVDYDSTYNFSSEEGFYIDSMDTLSGENGFEAIFDANGIDGNTELTKVNYIFYNKEEKADQSVITLVFNPSAVGFSELEAYDISSVFPNPTTDNFSIKHNLPKSVSSILKVYNSVGVLVLLHEIDNQKLISTFSVNDWEAGVYYLSIEIDGMPVGTEKLIKE